MTSNNGIEIGVDTLSIEGNPTQLYENLSKAHGEFLPIPKTAKGQIGKRDFKYADYATIMRCVRPALSKYGISVIQMLHSRGDRAVTTTILAGHGASVAGSFSFEPHKDPQEFGRHHTYYRRYQLQAALGIEGDKDADDLPDVNEDRRETSSYSEPERKTSPKAAESKDPASKDPASAGMKSAPVEQKTESSAKPSEPTTNGGKGGGKGKAGTADLASTTASETTAKSAEKPTGKGKTPAAVDLKTINEMLQNALKNELKWDMDQMRTFYKEHVDPAGFEKVANMTLEQKQALFKKLVELENVTPF